MRILAKVVRFSKPLLALLFIIGANSAAAAISISGQLNLPAGFGAQPFTFPSVSVFAYDSNRNFVDSYFESVEIPQGSNVASYTIQGIDDGVNIAEYVVRASCFGCGNIYPEQYFSLSGANNLLDDSSYIAKSSLPNTVNFAFVEGNTISGQVILATPNDTGDTVEVVVSTRYLGGFGGFSNSTFVQIPPGSSSASYLIDAINPDSGNNLTVAYNCDSDGSCGTKYLAAGVRPGSFASGTNRTNIDINVSDQGSIISGALLLPNSFDLGKPENEFANAFIDIYSGSELLTSRFISLIDGVNSYDYEFLIDPSNGNSSAVGYFCSGGCDGVIPIGYYQSSVRVYKTTEQLSNAESLDAQTDQIGIDFSLLPDANGDGIADPVSSNTGAIFLLLDGE